MRREYKDIFFRRRHKKQIRAAKFTPSIGFFVAAALAASAVHAVPAAPDTTRIIVAYKAGTVDKVRTKVGLAKGKIKHEIREMVQADQLPDSAAANRKVCIIDSGYDRNHEDLSANNVTGEYDAGTGWWYTDENHPGTHVAGTIAAINNSGTGVVGVNPNKTLKLHIVKVFGADGWAYSSTLATAANKCVTAGANVISMSLGGGRKSVTEQKAFDTAQSKGVLSIAAAGNDGNTVISYPAGYASAC